jgi:hypothetical protein
MPTLPDPIKKVINNGGFIVNLAPLLPPSPEASALVAAANAYVGILNWLGISASVDDFEGCEQGQLLVKWISPYGDVPPTVPDVDLMNTWTKDIWSSIADLAAGKLPT